MAIDLAKYGADYVTQVLAEIELVTKLPAISTEELYARFDELYRRANVAGDAQAMELVTTTWGMITGLASREGQAVTLASAAKQVADTLKEQRDTAIDSHTRLTSAMQTSDMSNPLVADVVNEARETFVENMIDAGVYIADDPIDDILTLANIPVGYVEALDLHHFISGVTAQDDCMSQEDYTRLANELAAFAKRFSAMVAEARARYE